MMMLLVIALMIVDIMIVGVLLVKAIQSIFRAKSITGALFWLVILAVIIVYAIAFFNVAILGFFDRGISILFYPVVFTVVYWILKKIKSCKKR